MQKEDLEGGDLIEGNKTFRGLVLNEIKELLGGDGDDFGRKSQALLDELYQGGGILRTEKSDGLFEGFGWIDPLFPLEAEDLGWGYKRNREDNADGLSLSSGANSKFKKQLTLIDEAVSRSSSRGVKTSSYQQKDITKELVDEVEKATLDIESTIKLITEKIDEQLDEAYDGNLPEAQKQARIDELLEELESVSVVQESSRLSYLALDKLKGILSKNERGDSWEYSWPESVHISRNSNGEIIGFAIMAVSATNMALEYQNRWNGLEDNVDGKVLLIDYLVSLHKEKDTGRTILSSILNEAKKNNVSLIQIETTNSSEQYWNKFGFSSPKRNKDWAVNGALPSYSFLNIGTQKETDDK
jgi:hypothetical protein